MEEAKIRKYLSENKIEEAKVFIEEQERKLLLKLPKYTETQLKKTVSKLKKIFSEHTFNHTFTGENKKVEVEHPEIKIKQKKVYVAVDKDDFIGEPTQCMEGSIQRSKNSEFTLFCSNSISIRECANVKIKGCSNQLRLTNCKNVYIELNDVNSISFENCTEIKIKKPEGKEIKIENFTEDAKNRSKIYEFY